MNVFWLRTWSLGVKNLLLHPLRSLLTVVGMFIGVASVIWLLAIGNGISVAVQKQIEGLGAENIIVRSIKPPSETLAGRDGPVPYGLTRDDFARLSETIPTVDRAVPVRELRREFRYVDRLIDGRLVGCTPEYVEATKLDVERGRFLSDADLQDHANVCVLAAGTATRLFPFEDPLGRSIKVEKDYYVVIGVTEDRAPSAGIGGSLDSQDYSHDVYIPISALWLRIGDLVITMRNASFEGEIVQLSQITLQVDEVEHVLLTAEIVKNTLADYHQAPDYGVTVPLELLEQAKTTQLMFILFLGLIAAISLLVGGIGIMNIMLATVTERTREIGIRRALGAKQSDIARQFLMETVVLSVVGGITGIVGGLTCKPATRLLRRALVELFPSAMRNLPDVVRELEPAVVNWSIPLAFGIAVAVGIVFGLYPARRAAALDPIEALRHE
ncbi:MAG TPA: ABC transporter permease [Pirellulales bacterium]|nr:ABC transporter permease [Pirellulales bacterium]